MEEKPQAEVSQAKQYYEKGLSAYEKANYDYAIELLSHAISLDPANAPARHALRLAERKKLEISPPSLFEKAKSTILAIQCGWFQLKRDSTKMMEVCEKILRTRPNHMKVLTKLAKLAMKADMVDVATRTFEEIFEVDPKNLFALKQLAAIYLKKRGLEKARLYFEHVLRLAPNDREADKGLKDLDALRTIEEGKLGQESKP